MLFRREFHSGIRQGIMRRAKVDFPGGEGLALEREIKGVAS